MNICIYGAGAVGGHMAARLLASGVSRLSIVARGDHLAAIRDNGITMIRGGRTYSGRPIAATDDPGTLPPQDLVIVTLKAASLPSVASSIARLLSHQGSVLFMTNGIPWWWNQGLPANDSQNRATPKTTETAKTAGIGALSLLDPQGDLWSMLRERTLGGVVYSGNRVASPGVIEGYGHDRWIVGEPAFAREANGRVKPVSSTRRDRVVALLKGAGFPAEATDDIRLEVWRKLIMNASMNTVAALTRITSEQLGTDADRRALLRNIMTEALAVARATGWELRDEVDIEKLAAPTADRTPGQRPSMLQDVLAGRPIEIEAILGQLVQFGADFEIATPTCRVLLTLLRGLDESLRKPAA